MSRGTAALGAALIASLAACELAEVAAPDSADVLIVEAVLRAGRAQQYVLLHRSLEGAVVRGEPGASITIVAPDASRVTFQAAPLSDCLGGSLEDWELGDVEIAATCYVSDPAFPYFLIPGSEYELEIETARGEVARGRTRLPAAFRFHSPSATVNPVTRVATCQLSTEPFTLVWGRAEGAWSYVVSLQLSDWGEDLREQGIELADTIQLTGVSVSAADTTLLFPENLGLFQRGELDQRIFRALAQGLPTGANATLTVVATDRNYTNAIRGGRFNPSGQVRGSSIVGDAVGVFGSVVPITIRSFHPAGGSPMPPCDA